LKEWLREDQEVYYKAFINGEKMPYE
jgi:hypothetical protein